MGSEQFDLFIILLKLKSYLVSLMDDPANSPENFEYTEEFLLRKYPEHKDEIIELLTTNNIISDAQIAFTENIQQKFREIVLGSEPSEKLSNILDKYQIMSIKESLNDKTLDDLKLLREQKLREIISVLLQLARVWSQRSAIENTIEDFSILDEEDLIRPEELDNLYKLDHLTTDSFEAISKLTNIYLEQLIGYYFKFGGDVSLVKFISVLEEFKQVVLKQYKNLFKEHGLDSDIIK